MCDFSRQILEMGCHYIYTFLEVCYYSHYKFIMAYISYQIAKVLIIGDSCCTHCCFEHQSI